MILKEVALTAKRPLSDSSRKIELDSRVICSILGVWLSKKKISCEFWKMSLRFDDPSCEDGQLLLGVLVCCEELNVSAYDHVPDVDKPKFILDYILDGIYNRIRRFGINSDDIAEARKFVIDNEYKNTFSSKWIRPESRDDIKLRIFLVQEFDKSTAYIEIINRDRKAQKFTIATDSTNEFQFQKYLNAKIDCVGENIIDVVVGSDEKYSVDVSKSG